MPPLSHPSAAPSASARGAGFAPKSAEEAWRGKEQARQRNKARRAGQDLSGGEPLIHRLAFQVAALPPPLLARQPRHALARGEAADSACTRACCSGWTAMRCRAVRWETSESKRRCGRAAQVGRLEEQVAWLMSSSCGNHASPRRCAPSTAGSSPLLRRALRRARQAWLLLAAACLVAGCCGKLGCCLLRHAWLLLAGANARLHPVRGPLTRARAATRQPRARGSAGVWCRTAPCRWTPTGHAPLSQCSSVPVWPCASSLATLPPALASKLTAGREGGLWGAAGRSATTSRSCGTSGLRLPRRREHGPGQVETTSRQPSTHASGA
jgi:hypothetical protein